MPDRPRYNSLLYAKIIFHPQLGMIAAGDGAGLTVSIYLGRIFVGQRCQRPGGFMR